MKEQKKGRKRFDLSVWVTLSALVVLVGILGVMMFAQFQGRKNQAELLFVEKGATLIRSFEAGLRYRGACEEDAFYLQKLLMETAQQPDIDYMIVTDERGRILADSEPAMLGLHYGLDLDTGGIAGSMEIAWRQTANPDGAGTFEVYRGFSPWRDSPDGPQRSPMTVFVGFDMSKIERASRQDAVRTVIIALILVLIGSLAIVSLFLVQAYRLTRSSLSRVTVFSEALVKNLPIGLIALDHQGRIAACNEKARDLFDVACPDALGNKADTLLPGALWQLLEDVRGDAGVKERDVTLTDSRHETRNWEVVAATFVDDEANEGRILLARDVTALRLMEQEVARSRHLRAIGSLAAGVAHEIRNPLSSIRGFAVYFKERLSGHPDDQQTADIMIAETERLNRVITQLIDFARPLTLKKEPANLADLVLHSIRLVAAEAGKNAVAIEVRAKDDLPAVEVDADRVKQVLLNIFLNALAAMPGGGRLSVEFAILRDCVEVSVSDTGEGIPAEHMPRIYDPYFTSKPAGTGLGLAVVQKIMDAHGGWIQIESTAGQGTNVVLRFPLPVQGRSES
ncbi:MAG: ATP-binding protein [Smithellaceae bacterium]